MTAGQGATPLPWVLTPDTGGKADPADIARKAQENFDALARTVGQSRSVDWVAVTTFAAGWSDYGTGFMNCAYRKDASGAVWLRGTCQKSSGPSVNETILTLPAGYIPALQLIFPNGVGAGRVDVVNDGRVAWVAGSGSIVSLDAIRFFTV